MTPSNGSEPTITAGDYLLYRACPRSLHRRLIGAASVSRSPADTRYPVTSDRVQVAALARQRMPAAAYDTECRHGPFRATADIRQVRKGETEVALVREGTGIKGSYLREAAFLDWCLSANAAPPDRILLLYLNKAYERCGALDPARLFAESDITRRVRKLAGQTAAELERLRDELAEDPALERYRDRRCERPRSCPVCATDEPAAEEGHVSTLHRGGHLVHELLEDGILSIVDVPEDRLTHRRHTIQQQTLRRGTPHVEVQQLRAFLETLAYPIRYLDFEAVCHAVPLFDGVRPWEHVAYLYSIHTESADHELRHCSYFMAPGTDTRREMIDRLRDDLGEQGSIVVYSAGFERSILHRLMDLAPEAAGWVVGTVARFVDLLSPFDAFAFYDKGQRGKVSLKSVLPVLTDFDYADQAVRDGYTASRAYRYLCEQVDGAPDAVSDEAAEPTGSLLADLVSYCAHDTFAMVAIVRALREVVGP